jgi:hygromycin-B 4-O-kinase
MELALASVRAFLSDHLGARITNIKAVGQGEWSQAFFFQAGGQQKVVRFSRLDEDFQKDRFASRFASANLPIPRIEELGEAFDGYFAISPRIAGKMIDHLDAAEMAAALPALWELFDALRRADLSQTSGYGGWDGRGVAGRSSWQEFLLSIASDDAASRINWQEALAGRPRVSALFQRVYGELQRLVGDCPEERQLIHNDLLHFNLLLDGDRIAGVIDWGCALYGDFLYDLAMFDLWQFYYPAMQGIDFKAEAKAFYGKRGVPLPHFEQRLRCYEFHLALDAMKYCAYKDHERDLRLITNRIEEIL